jgi:hypothetical protein
MAKFSAVILTNLATHKVGVIRMSVCAYELVCWAYKSDLSNTTEFDQICSDDSYEFGLTKSWI